MEPAPLRLKGSIGDMPPPGRRISVDEEPPYSFSDDLARGSVQGTLATTPSCDSLTNGRTQDFPKSCRQLQDSSQEDAGYGSPESARFVRPEAQQDHYPLSGRGAVSPEHHSRHQPDFAIAQTSTSSATPFYGMKAEDGEQTRRLIARAPLRPLAPLLASSPFILKSQPEGMEALEPFPADSSLVLRSQPEEKKV